MKMIESHENMKQEIFSFVSVSFQPQCLPFSTPPLNCLSEPSTLAPIFYTQI